MNSKNDSASLVSNSSRFDRLDALRGFSIVWMTIFHFCFDLNHFRFIQQNFYNDPFWTVQRMMIVSLFMYCAGLSQSIALEQQVGWPRFWKRWVQIAGCAILVSIGSWWMFPQSYISFGVLHAFALMQIIIRLCGGLRNWLWPLGFTAILLPQFIQHHFFDSRWTNWVGLVTHKPITEDYAPLLPWIGIVFWGMASGQWILKNRPQWLKGSLPSPLRGLSFLGRWSLSFYMIHQPILIGSLMLITELVR